MNSVVEVDVDRALPIIAVRVDRRAIELRKISRKHAKIRANLSIPNNPINEMKTNSTEENATRSAYHGIGDLGRDGLERRVLGQVDGEEARVRHGQHVVRALPVLHIQTRLSNEISKSRKMATKIKFQCETTCMNVYSLHDF